jgi:hypothetical protein
MLGRTRLVASQESWAVPAEVVSRLEQPLPVVLGQVELLGDGVDVDVQLLISGTCSPVPSRRRRVRPAPVENGQKFLADRDKAAGTQARLNVKFGLRRAEPVFCAAVVRRT